MPRRTRPESGVERITGAQWLARAAGALRAACGSTGSREAPDREARALLARASGLSALSWYAHPERVLESDWLADAEELLRRRSAREPLAYLVGALEWYGREFLVRPGVLVPRPDTEALIDWVAMHLPGLDGWVLDVGTGSGCLLATLLCEHPGARGVGIDPSARALEVAAENLTRLGLEARSLLVRADGLHALASTCSPPLIVSNPPYVTASELARCEPEVRDHEPREALLVPDEDPLRHYREILDQARRFATRPAVLFEVGAGRSEAVTALLRERGYSEIRVLDDLLGIPRAVGALL